MKRASNQDSNLRHCYHAWGSQLGCLAAMLLSFGCHQATHLAGSLPNELLAPSVVDVKTLNLSSLASGSSSHLIHPGDSLTMTIVTGAEDRQPDSWLVRVTDDGAVEVPLVGAVQLAGYDLQTAQNLVRQASVERGIFRQPSVSITVESRQTNHVTVLGAVDQPGEFDLPIANSNLVAAMAMAGGVTELADRYIEIRQPTTVSAGEGMPPRVVQQSVRVDLLEATKGGPTSPLSYALNDGAVVNVGQRARRYIHVLGLVNRPDQFELPVNQNVRVLDALALAGGRQFSFADRIFVVRQVSDSAQPALIQVSVKQAKSESEKNLLLQDGDVVSVEQTPTTLVLGTLQQFIRLGVNGSVF